jgi:hypothetical protein
MDWSAVAVAIADGIIALTAVAGVILGIQGRNRDAMQEQRRAEWERDQEQKRLEWERRQLDSAAPHLAPIGGNWYGLASDSLPNRLQATPQIQIPIQNQGNSMPQAVMAVLFPARVKNPQSGQRTDNLYGHYWEGKLDASPGPGETPRLDLNQKHYPLSGEQSIIEGLTLFAPDEPNLSLPQSDPMFFARLSLSYRDASGRTLGLVYDAEAVMKDRVITQEWRRVEGPVVIAKSLQQLTEETARNKYKTE